MEGNEGSGGTRTADEALDEHVTAIMSAVAIADNPGDLREFIYARLRAFSEAATGMQVSCDALANRVRQVMLSGDVDNIVTDAEPAATSAMSTLRNIAGLTRCATSLDDLSYSGAVLASVLLSRPWLASFSLEVKSEATMGDEGGFFNSYSLEVDSVNALVGAKSEHIPEDIQDEEGGLDSSMAADDIASELENAAPSFAAAVGLADGGDEEFTFTVERSALRDVFDSSAASHTPISGAAIARVLWPERMAWVVAGLGVDAPNQQLGHPEAEGQPPSCA